MARREEAQREGNAEGEGAEVESAATIALHTAHIQLQAGQEHDVVDAHLAEDLERAVALQHMETVGTHQDAGQDEADDVRQVKPAEQHRRKEDDGQHHEENLRGIGYQGCARG